MSYHFAWVAPGTAFNAAVHNVEDEEIFSFKLLQQEGEFAQLNIEVINPRVGLLSVGREQWCWFSYNDGATITPMFYGRMVGIPQSMIDDIVEFSFIARPQNYESIKNELAESLKVFPFWDPLFLAKGSAEQDPDVVLEARPELFHTDRVTHALTTSNILLGEAGTIDFGEDPFYDSVTMSHLGSPGRVAKVVAEVNWEQRANDAIDISSHFPQKIETYTGEGLLNDWPQPGAKIGKDWSVFSSRPIMVPGRRSWILPMVSRDFFRTTAIITDLPITSLRPQMSVQYDVKRGFTERIRINLVADVQAMLTEPGDEEIIMLDFSGDADVIVDHTNSPGSGSAGTGTGHGASSGDPPELAPIRDPRARRYFSTLRGRESVRFLLTVARAHLMARARAISISFEVPLQDALAITCRHSASITDPRIPGGGASGKVMAYEFSLDGNTGSETCKISLGCTVGNGGSNTVPGGTSGYVEDGYGEANYFYRDNEGVEVTSDLYYESFDNVPTNDDGVDFTAIASGDIVDEINVYNERAAQASAIGGGWGVGGYISLEALMDAMNQLYTEIEVKLIDFGEGPFETEINLVTSELKIIKTIDLEAA